MSFYEASFYAFAYLAVPTLLLLAWLGRLAWLRRERSGGRSLTALAALAGAWLLCSLGEILLPTPGLSALAARLQYAFIPWLPVAWLAFALTFMTQRRWWRSPLVQVAAAVGLVTTVLALSPWFDGLVWTEAASTRVGRFWATSVHYGPWFWVHAAVSWVLTLAGAYLVLREYVRSHRAYRRLSGWMAFGVTVPIFINAITVTGLLPKAKDFSSIGFSISAAAFVLGVRRYRLLDLHPVARARLVETMSEALAVVDTSGRLVDANPAMLRLVGDAFGPGRLLADVFPALRPALDIRSGTVTLEGAAGPRHLEWSASALREDGDALGRLILLRDETERIVAQQDLHDALAELHTRNEQLGAFAHMVAHDLKTPINNIRGYAQLLQDEGDAMPAALREECLGVLVQTSEKMNGIIEGLLLLAGVREAEVSPVPIDMAHAVGEALERLSVDLEASSAAVEVPDAWPLALGYGPWVEEVWTNYISNAIKYGGRPPHLTLGAQRQDDTVWFWVDDDGSGIPPGREHEVFQPFLRLEPERAEGHGIGLAVVARIVERLGGSCRAERRGEGGSRFSFALPAAEIEAPPEPPTFSN